MLYNNLKSIGYNGGQYKAIMKGGNCLAGLSDAYSYIKITSNMECDVEISRDFSISTPYYVKRYHFNKGDNYILAQKPLNDSSYYLNIFAKGDIPLIDIDLTNFKERSYIDIKSETSYEIGKIICPDNISLGFIDCLFDRSSTDFRGKKIHYMYIPNSINYHIKLGTIYRPSNYSGIGLVSFGGLYIESVEGIDSSVTEIRIMDDLNLKNNLTKIMNANQDNHAIKIYVTEKAYNLVDDDLRTLAEQKNFTIEIGH